MSSIEMNEVITIERRQRTANPMSL